MVDDCIGPAPTPHSILEHISQAVALVITTVWSGATQRAQHVLLDVCVGEYCAIYTHSCTYPSQLHSVIAAHIAAGLTDALQLMQQLYRLWLSQLCEFASTSIHSGTDMPLYMKLCILV